MDQISKTIDNESDTYSPDRSARLTNEINNIKRELESHKDLIRELANAKLRLEHQIRDIEQAYREDVMLNSFVTAKQEQLQQALRGYQDNYRRLEMMNRDIIQAYEKTRSDLDTLHTANTRDRGTDELEKLTRNQQNLNRMQSPPIYQQAEIPKNETENISKGRQLLQKKDSVYIQQSNAYQSEVPKRNRQDEDHVKDILSWQVPKGNSKYSLEDSDRPTEYASNFKNPVPYKNKNDESNRSIRGNRFNQTRRSPEDSHIEPKSNDSFILNERETPYLKYNSAPTAKTSNDMQNQPTPDKAKNSQSSSQQTKNRLTFPSQQRYEDNFDEIGKLHQWLTELVSQKQTIENSLIKMPLNGRTLAEKRKKAALERDLETIESAIDEIKQHLKDLDAFLVE